MTLTIVPHVGLRRLFGQSRIQILLGITREISSSSKIATSDPIIPLGDMSDPFYLYTSILARSNLYPDGPSREFSENYEPRLPDVMPKAYDPRVIEPAVGNVVRNTTKFLDRIGGRRNGPPSDFYTICLPPINVTGQLHLGHGLTCAIQDTLVRWNVMKGRRVKWIIGFDHAGIATQVRVSKEAPHLATDKTSITRRMISWKDAKIREMDGQLRGMGLCADWPTRIEPSKVDGGDVNLNYHFTLDRQFSDAVGRAFCHLHHGHRLVYRSERLVNWCFALRTAISDMECLKVEVDGPTVIQVPVAGKGATPTSVLTPITFGRIWKIAYPLWDEPNPHTKFVDFRDGGTYLTVYTTRPETVMADVALAVNPKDTRYSGLRGKLVRHPCYPHMSRPLPIIFDDRIDPEFGSGVMKVTPGHDIRDFAIALDHGDELSSTRPNATRPPLNIFREDGTVGCDVPLIGGLERFGARDAILKYLSSRGPVSFLLGTEDHKTTIKVCSRSGDIVESMPKPQWYLKCRGELSQSLIRFLENDLDFRIWPGKPHGRDELLDWLRGIDDWCLSRQISWGHRIPAYSFTDEWNQRIAQSVKEGVTFMKRNPLVYGEKAHFIAGSKEEAFADGISTLRNLGLKNADLPNLEHMEQDHDVLDTWFSSALYPCVVTGAWPAMENGQTGGTKYPLSLMETGFDIRHLWVARMLLLGLRLTGKLPFQEVLYHGIVNDSFGRKMSKSLGNVIDPLDIVNGATLDRLKEKLCREPLSEEEKSKALKGQKELFLRGIPACGSDAMKFALLRNDVKTQAVKIDINRMDEYRKFGNKIWQATRYTLGTLAKFNIDPRSQEMTHFDRQNGVVVSNTEDVWILSRLRHLATVCDGVFCAGGSPLHTPNKYEFQEAVEALYKFWLNEFCDTYLECSKGILTGRDGAKSASTPDISIKQVTSCIATLYTCCNIGLRLLHPFMPHLTQALWSYITRSLQRDAKSDHNLKYDYPIGLTSYPNATDSFFTSLFPSTLCNQQESKPAIEVSLDTLNDRVSVIIALANASKSLRQNLKITKEKPNLVIVKRSGSFRDSAHKDPLELNMIEDISFLMEGDFLRMLITLARCSTVSVLNEGDSNDLQNIPTDKMYNISENCYITLTF